MQKCSGRSEWLAGAAMAPEASAGAAGRSLQVVQSLIANLGNFRDSDLCMRMY